MCKLHNSLNKRSLLSYTKLEYNSSHNINTPFNNVIITCVNIIANTLDSCLHEYSLSNLSLISDSVFYHRFMNKLERNSLYHSIYLETLLKINK